MRKWIISGDWHVPWEDKKAIELMLLICDDLVLKNSLEGIILNGDVADMYFVNTFGRDPSIKLYIMDERQAVTMRLRNLSMRYPGVKKIFVVGNHEQRFAKYFSNKCPELYGLMDLDTFLGITENGYQIIEYGPYQKYLIPETDIIVRHEPNGGGQHSSRNTVMRSSANVIYSHTHQIQESSIVSIDERVLSGINIGCMCDFKNPEAPFQYVQGHHNWQLSFCVVTVISRNLWFSEVVKIKQRSKERYAYFEGKLYQN